MSGSPYEPVEYASLLSYVSTRWWRSRIIPDSKRRDLENANNYTLALKQDLTRPGSGDVSIYDYVAEQCSDQGLFPGFFSDDTTLVPVPGNCPREPGSMWAPELLACALERHGLGCRVVPYLERTKLVRKSARSPGNRPLPIEHHDTIAVQRRLTAPSRILLVDDVVTTGSTFLGSAWLMREAYPDTDIKAFAAMRTIGYVNSFKRLVCPCTGKLTLNRDMEPKRGKCSQAASHVQTKLFDDV